MRLVILLAILFPLPGAAVKFWADVVPAAASVTTITVNAGGIWRGVKRTPKVVAATPKGPKAMVRAAKGKK